MKIDIINSKYLYDQTFCILKLRHIFRCLMFFLNVSRINIKRNFSIDDAVELMHLLSVYIMNVGVQLL